MLVQDTFLKRHFNVEMQSYDAEAQEGRGARLWYSLGLQLVRDLLQTYFRQAKRKITKPLQVPCAGLAYSGLWSLVLCVPKIGVPCFGISRWNCQWMDLLEDRHLLALGTVKHHHQLVSRRPQAFWFPFPAQGPRNFRQAPPSGICSH